MTDWQRNSFRCQKSTCAPTLLPRTPIGIRKHTIKYGVAFKASALTADTTNAKSAVEFNEANLYIPLDKNTDVKKTKMTRGDDLSLTWSDGETEDVASYEKTMLTHLSMNDEITNLSPIYQSIIGEANDELSLILSMVCTPKQIENIFAADTKTQCSNDELNDMEQEECSCCMMREMYVAQSEPNDVIVCDSVLKDSDKLVSDLSLLAYYDGGVAIKQAGETEYTGNGIFVQTMHKQTQIYSPVIQTHTVNEWLFGHPSAYIGKVIPTMYFAQALKTMKDKGFDSKSDTAKELLIGSMDDILPIKIGDVALYTKNVGTVSKDHAYCLQLYSSSISDHYGFPFRRFVLTHVRMLILYLDLVWISRATDLHLSVTSQTELMPFFLEAFLASPTLLHMQL